MNQARLEASIRVNGLKNYQKKWPSPFAIGSGILLALSFLKFVYPPLQWLALVGVAVGIPPIIFRGVAAIRNLTLDINILVLIAGTFCLFYLLNYFCEYKDNKIAFLCMAYSWMWTWVVKSVIDIYIRIWLFLSQILS